jgi:alpha-galactosidase
MVRAEIDSSTFVHGVISKDKSEALFAYVTLSAAMGSRPSAILLPGLSADKSYRVRAMFPAGEPTYLQRTQVEWLEGIELTGAALASVGLRPPVLFPENAMLIEVKES